jgi:hypothetical protein
MICIEIVLVCFIIIWRFSYRYNWNIVESGIKHHNPTPTPHIVKKLDQTFLKELLPFLTYNILYSQSTYIFLEYLNTFVCCLNKHVRICILLRQCDQTIFEGIVALFNLSKRIIQCIGGKFCFCVQNNLELTNILLRKKLK